MTNKGWYCADAEFGHVGAGRGIEVNIYIRAKDLDDAFRRYHMMPGIKNREDSRSIRKLTEKESNLLEGYLAKKRLLHRSKKCGYIPDFEDDHNLSLLFSSF